MCRLQRGPRRSEVANSQNSELQSAILQSAICAILRYWHARAQTNGQRKSAKSYRFGVGRHMGCLSMAE
eukprot:1362723-Alexandrium_andersonii.AAC.1